MLVKNHYLYLKKNGKKPPTSEMEEEKESMSVVDLVMMGYSGDKAQDTRKVVEGALTGKVSTTLNKPELFTLASLLVKFICPLKESSVSQNLDQGKDAPDVAKSSMVKNKPGLLTQFEKEEQEGSISEQKNPAATIVASRSPEPEIGQRALRITIHHLRIHLEKKIGLFWHGYIVRCLDRGKTTI